MQLQPRQSKALNILYGSDAKSPLERFVLKLSSAGFVVAALAVSVPKETVSRNPMHFSFYDRALLAITAVGYLSFVAGFLYLGIRVTGRSAGKTGFFGQLGYVVMRTSLFIFLPCAVITVGILIAMWLTGNLQL